MTPGSRLLAAGFCRVYALLPFAITPLLAGVAAQGPRAATGVGAGLAAAVLAGLAVPGLRRTADALLLSALGYAGVVLGSGLLADAAGGPAPLRAVLGMAGCFGLAGSALALLERGPRGLRARARPDLLPDLLTGLSLLLLFAPLLALHRHAGRRRAFVPPPTPWRVRVVVTSYEEEATVAHCLGEIQAAATRARQLGAVAGVQVVLADSDSADATRRRAAPLADAVWRVPRGKLRARHAAYLREGAEVLVAADADRSYPEDWLERLLAPLSAGALAVTGETGTPGAPVSGSALVRGALCLPFNGGNAAFFREAYLAAPHAIAVDNFRHRALWTEEEFRFGLGLRALGQVAYAPVSSLELRPYGLWRVFLRHACGVRLRSF